LLRRRCETGQSAVPPLTRLKRR